VLLRGNHECRPVNRVYGFYDELHERFSKEEARQLFEAFNDVFSHLPLAALIGRKILCMHGGIGPEIVSLDDICKVTSSRRGDLDRSRVLSTTP